MPKPKLKKPTKPKKPKKSGKQPRPIESPPQAAAIEKAPKARTDVIPSSRNMRMLAKIDYVTDPEDRSLRYHYDRDDREYKDSISFDRFKEWSAADKWVESRAAYYAEIENRIIASRLDRLMEQKFREMDELEEDLKYMREWVTPLRDQYGNVRRYPLQRKVGDPKKGTFRTEMHPFAGLPMYALEFKSMDKLISAFLKIDERLMLKRGDATTRSETSDTSPTRPSVLDSEKMLTTVSKEEREAMAKALLFQRQPELQSQPLINVDKMIEQGDNDDGDTI